jgi:ketosteroid isomerase-like protein
MVWPWPARDDAHDPVEWRFGMGRFAPERWRDHYGRLFSEWRLVHNHRRIVKIELSAQEDGAFAVVDIDTLWRQRDGGDEMNWKGRVCKVYARVGSEWKMTMHTGALTYPASAAEAARQWVETWSRAWPAADAEAISALYAADALFYSHPFREPQTPRSYVEAVFADQARAECRFGEPVVDGDRAAVDWWGVIVARDGSVETVAGTSLLRFDANGLVVEQRDAWAGEPVRRELPDWA